ncbi:MAG TPA: aminotransferase class I/II-fold pyridoxal phosphate-dependent enzyme [Candidatus Nanoarchaeia archaeon]|nr:aminotransferase class I/II-fold pyridoxal phosphate-dependent enzyme [Candidatus Nanoarchaeia archaeon]
MILPDFRLERYFAQYEFAVRHLLCASDCETMTVRDLFYEGDQKALMNLRLGYTESQGDSELRITIANLYDGIDRSQIVTCAPEEGIFLTINAIVHPRDRVIVQSPCYQSLEEIAKGIGAKVTRWQAEERGNQWYWDLEGLEKQLERTRLLVLNSPHNPTGHTFSRAEYKRIMRLAEDHGCLVLSDEMYRFSEYRKQDRLPSGAEFSEHCVSLGGLSKTFGLPGLRMGWLVVRDPKIREKICAQKDYTTICSSAPSEFIAARALRKRTAILKRNNSIIAENLPMLQEFFAARPQFTFLEPKAGPIALVRYDGESATAFCDEMVKKAGVLLLPSTLYDFGDHHFRVGFGRKNMPEALEAFGKYLVA